MWFYLIHRKHVTNWMHLLNVTMETSTRVIKHSNNIPGKQLAADLYVILLFCIVRRSTYGSTVGGNALAAYWFYLSSSYIKLDIWCDFSILWVTAAQYDYDSWLTIKSWVSMVSTSCWRSHFQPQSRLAAMSSNAICQLSTEKKQRWFLVFQ